VSQFFNQCAIGHDPIGQLGRGVKKPRSFERGSVSQPRGARSRMGLRILDVRVSLFAGLLGF
jgi:hypothetical protein